MLTDPPKDRRCKLQYMKKTDERREEDCYVIIEKDFMKYTFKIIYSLIVAIIYILLKLV